MAWQAFYDDVLVLKVLLHLSCVCAARAHMSRQGSSRANGRTGGECVKFFFCWLLLLRLWRARYITRAAAHYMG